MMTKGGVPLLYPFSRKKISLTWCKSGGKYEFFTLGFLCVIAIVLTVLFIKNGIFLTYMI